MLATNVRDEFIPLRTFLYRDEAIVARGLLLSAGILCYLENDHTLTANWCWNIALGGYRLMVPESVEEETREMLTAVELETPFEHSGQGRRGSRARWALGIGVLMSPVIESLALLTVLR
jgi:hypothetical protein